MMEVLRQARARRPTLPYVPAGKSAERAALGFADRPANQRVCPILAIASSRLAKVVYRMIENWTT